MSTEKKVLKEKAQYSEKNLGEKNHLRNKDKPSETQ